MQAHQHDNDNENTYMPLMLKFVLEEFGISQRRWAESIIQTRGRSKGRPLSPTAATQILNWNRWPTETYRSEIESQTVELLRDCGVPENLINTVWAENQTDKSAGPDDDVQRFRPGSSTHPRNTQPEKEKRYLQDMEAEMLSSAARQTFKLFRDPFSDDVQGAEDVFLSENQRYVRESMFQAARHGGFIAVIGESGAGKSTLRRDLIDRINREEHPISVIQPRVIDKGRLTAGAICDAIIRDISNQTPRLSLEAKARQLEKLLTDSSRGGNHHVLIIEEAHDLSVQTLKYLKRFWELEDGFRKLLSIILIGQPEMHQRLNVQRNYEAREVIRRCEVVELLPLNKDLEGYLSLKFRRINKKLEDIFEDGAIEAIRQRLTARRGNQVVSEIYPLVVNNVIIRALNFAASLGADKISADIVADLIKEG